MLWLLRKGSGYGVEPRYLFIFWGFIPVLMAEFIGRSFQEIQAFTPAKHQRFRKFFLLLPALFFVGPFFTSLDSIERRSFRIPPRTFTRYAEAYSWIKRETGNGAVLLIQDTCYTQETPMLYLKYFPNPHLGAFAIIDTFGCQGAPLADDRQKIMEFLQTYPNPTVVFDSRWNACSEMAKRAKSLIPGPEKAAEIDVGIACMQVYRNIHSFSDLAKAAEKNGLRHDLRFFQE
jgi:hypothetical protein